MIGCESCTCLADIHRHAQFKAEVHIFRVCGVLIESYSRHSIITSPCAVRRENVTGGSYILVCYAASHAGRYSTQVPSTADRARTWKRLTHSDRGPFIYLCSYVLDFSSSSPTERSTLVGFIPIRSMRTANGHVLSRCEV